jgi:hypothetical protein
MPPIFDTYGRIIGLRIIPFLTFEEAYDSNSGVRLTVAALAISTGLNIALIAFELIR